MFKRIWQQIVRWFQRLFGRGRSASGVASSPSSAPPPELTNTDLEFLFTQLLEGVHEGRGQEWAIQWLQRLENRVSTARWVEWLRSFGDRLLASPTPNNELAARLVALGDLGIGEVGDVAYEIGMGLLTRDAGEPIWEYAGPDEEAATPASPEEAGYQTITLDDLFGLLQQDESVRASIAQQVGLETNDPQEIIQALVSQLQAANAQAATPSTPEDAEGWLDLGVQQGQAGDFAAAIASFDQAIKLQADMHEAWYDRGSAFGNLGQFENAVACYDKALEIKPDKEEAWTARGLALAMLGKPEDAIASCDKAIAINSNNQEAWKNRGLSEISLSRWQDAIASFNQAIAINPDNDDYWNCLGVSQANLKQFAQAVESFDKALEINPDNFLTWFNRGRALAEVGQHQEAIASLDKAIGIKPDYQEAWNLRSQVMEKLS